MNTTYSTTQNAAQSTQTPAVSESLLTQKAILVHIGLTQIGRTRQLREGAVEIATVGDHFQAVNTDKNLVRVTKTLFQCAELKRIEKLDTEIRAFIARKCLPCPLKGKSVYLIPLGMVETVDKRLHEFGVERGELVAAFEKVYPRLLVKARRALRDLFDRHDYPRRENVAACFRLDWQFIALGVPDALGEISSDIWERERQKAALGWKAVEGEIQQVLRVRLKQMLENLSERLQPGADGKAKIFRNTLVSNINDFMADFHALNVTNDQDLSKIADDVRDLLSGVEPQTLRESQSVRGVVLDGAKALENQLTTLIVDKPKRLISFEDD